MAGVPGRRAPVHVVLVLRHLGIGELCQLMCTGVGSRVGFPADGSGRREVGGHLL
jgi:hypothetical protein